MLAILSLPLSLYLGPPPAAGAPLVVVGAGVLGRLVGGRWRRAQGEGAGEVLAVTRRADAERDAELAAEGFTPVREPARCANVVFCSLSLLMRFLFRSRLSYFGRLLGKSHLLPLFLLHLRGSSSCLRLLGSIDGCHSGG